MADENEQLDEIMALQSIYEDGTFICNFSDKPITGSISITIETNAEEHNFICNGCNLSCCFKCYQNLLKCKCATITLFLLKEI